MGIIRQHFFTDFDKRVVTDKHVIPYSVGVYEMRAGDMPMLKMQKHLKQYFANILCLALFGNIILAPP